MKAGDAAAVERLDALTTLAADIVLTPEETSAGGEEMSAEDKALNTAAHIYIEQAYDDTSKLTDEDKQTIIRDFKAGSRWQKERLRAVLESAIAAVRAVEALAAAFNPKQEVDLNAHIHPKIDVTQMAYNELFSLYKTVKEELRTRINETPKLW